MLNGKKSEFRNGKNTPAPPVFSQEWQAKGLRDTELGSVYGEWKRGRPQRLRAEEEMGWLASNKWLTIITTPPPVFQK
jgi:hypothetical protein